MIPNPHLYEKLAQAHHEDLLREAKQRCLLAHLPPHRKSLARQLPGKLGVLLVALGTSVLRLKPQYEQTVSAVAHSRAGSGGNVDRTRRADRAGTFREEAFHLHRSAKETSA